MRRFIVTVELDDNTGEKFVGMINTDTYLSKLINDDLNRIVKFEEGIYYDKNLEVLFSATDEKIRLSKIELALFTVLFENVGEKVSIENIGAFAWKGKTMTRYTLRNYIKNLRNKTYYGFIKCHSNLGYSLEVSNV